MSVHTPDDLVSLAATADILIASPPGVLIAPHVGGASSAMRPRITRLARRQIDRLLADEPPSTSSSTPADRHAAAASR